MISSATDAEVYLRCDFIATHVSVGPMKKQGDADARIPAKQFHGGEDQPIRYRIGGDALARQARGGLRAVGRSFNEFVVLRATDQLCGELDGAVSQREVASRTGLTEMATSRAMRRLEGRGLVSRGPAFISFAWRVFVSREGANTLRECASLAAAPSERMFASTDSTLAAALLSLEQR